MANGRNALQKTLAIFFFGFFVFANSSIAVAFEFTNGRCEFGVEFPAKPQLKTRRVKLGEGVYSETFIATVAIPNSNAMLDAQCDTSLALVPGLPIAKRRQGAEWTLSQIVKLLRLKDVQIYWEDAGGEKTANLRGYMTIVQSGKSFQAGVIARVYIGDQSTMMVRGIEPSDTFPSWQVDAFVKNSVTRKY
jgi:hypothetical protein